ncbi:MAG TPA: hypothetical protein PLH93_02700 [Flavobacteriales bacterium]|nr:hypothetical protein [Flavobacteriales bacterium]
MEPMLRILVLLTLSANLMAVAQQAPKVRVKVKADLGRRLEDGTTLHTVVKGDEGALIAMQVPADAAVLGGRPQAGMAWNLVTYDRATLSPIKSAAPKMVYGETPVAVETIGRHQRKLWLFGSKVDLERSGIQVLRQEMNPRSLQGVKGTQEHALLTFDRFGKDRSWFAQGSAVGLTFLPSVDTTRFMLTVDPRSTQRPGAPWFAAVFHKDLSLFWARAMEVDPAVKEIVVAGTILDGDGVLWRLVKWVTDPAPKVKDQVGYSWAVVRMDSTGQQQVIVDLPGAPYAQDVRMALRKDGALMVAGTYGEPTLRRDQSKGLFIATFDRKALAWGPFKLHTLQPAVVKEKKELQVDVVAEDLQVFSDGGAVLLANESALRTIQSKNFANQPVTRQSYVTRDLHVVRVDATGEQLWYTVLDREVNLEKPGRGAPVAFVQNDLLHVLMNDDMANEEIRKSGEPVPPLDGGGEALLLEFKADGTSKARSVVNGGADVATVLPERRWMVAPNETVMLAGFKLQGEKTFPLSVQFEQETKR